MLKLLIEFWALYLEGTVVTNPLNSHFIAKKNEVQEDLSFMYPFIRLEDAVFQKVF